MTARQFLVHGLLAGLVAGLLAFGVAHSIGEPAIDAAIAVEESGSAHDHGTDAAAHDHGAAEEELVSRDTQSTWGLLTATLLVGTAIGGVAGLISALAVGRLGRLRPEASTVVVVALGFLAAYAVPFAKYPANPPAVGSPGTIGARTASFFAFVAFSVAFAVAAALLARRLQARLDTFTAVVAGVVSYAVVMLVVARVMPTYHEVPEDFPATTLYDFRFATFATQLTLWSGVALVLGLLLVRARRRVTTAADAADGHAVAAQHA